MKKRSRILSIGPVQRANLRSRSNGDEDPNALKMKEMEVQLKRLEDQLSEQNKDEHRHHHHWQV